MFVLRISILVMIFTFFQNGETVVRGSSRTNDNIAVRYNNLMKIDTGYSHEDLKNTQVTESTVRDVEARIYNSLLCDFVFTCRHFMNLVARSSWGIEEAPDFQFQVVKMFFVLKHLGPLNSLDPLWQMYVYLECLKNVSYENIKESAVVNHDLDIVYGLLIQFTDKNCPPENNNNDQYGESEYSNQLQTVSSTDGTLAKYTFASIIDSTEDRFSKIREILRLDDNMIFFSINDLRLPNITLNNDIITTLVTHYVEINLFTAEDEPEIYTRIQSYCAEYRDSKPPHVLFGRIGECLRMFDGLMKYIIAHNALKYVLDVQSTLPNIGNQSTDVLAEWIQRENIMTANATMLSYLNDITSFLKMDDDEELKFVAGILDSEQHVAFSDPNKNIDNINAIKNILEKCTNVLYNNAPLTVMLRDDLDLSYNMMRTAKLFKLARSYGIKVSDPDEFKYVGMLDLFVFKSFIATQFDPAHLDIAHSFFKFSENFYGGK